MPLGCTPTEEPVPIDAGADSGPPTCPEGGPTGDPDQGTVQFFPTGPFADFVVLRSAAPSTCAAFEVDGRRHSYGWPSNGEWVCPSLGRPPGTTGGYFAEWARWDGIYLEPHTVCVECARFEGHPASIVTAERLLRRRVSPGTHRVSLSVLDFGGDHLARPERGYDRYAGGEGVVNGSRCVPDGTPGFRTVELEFEMPMGEGDVELEIPAPDRGAACAELVDEPPVLVASDRVVRFYLRAGTQRTIVGLRGHGCDALWIEGITQRAPPIAVCGGTAAPAYLYSEGVDPGEEVVVQWDANTLELYDDCLECGQYGLEESAEAYQRGVPRAAEPGVYRASVLVGTTLNLGSEYGPGQCANYQAFEFEFTLPASGDVDVEIDLPPPNTRRD